MLKNLLFILLCLIAIPTLAQEHFYDFIVRGQGATTEPIYGNDKFALFTSNYNKNGLTLYCTDGTTAGTFELLAYDKGILGFQDFFEHGGFTYFMLNNSFGNEIWRTDGTVSGTKMLTKAKTVNTFNFRKPVLKGNDIYYIEFDENDSFYIMRSDTSFTKPIVAARIKKDVRGPSNLVATDNYVFVGSYSKIFRIDDNNKLETYFEKSGQVPVGVNDLYEHNNAIIWHMRESSSRTMVYAGKETIGSHKEVEKLYGYIYFRDWEGIGKHFYYSEAEYRGNPQLHRLNTENLTQEDVRSTADPYVGQQVFEIAQFKGQLYFQGFVSGDVELWKTGATNAATVRLKDIAADTSGRPQQMTPAGNKLYFSAYTRNNGRELWSTDGTSAGTKLAADLLEGPEESQLGTILAPLKNSVISPGYTHSKGLELWISDGTKNGTELLLEQNFNFDYGDQMVSGFMHAGDYMYLFASDSVIGKELWRTDGTQEGTILLDNINIAHLPSEISEHIEFKGNLYGTALSFIEGFELYKSDGTPGGSGFVTPSDLFSSSAPRNYVVEGNYMYFIARRGLFSGEAIFRSDGTKAGTKPYLATGNDIKSIDNLTKVGDSILVSITDNDGTEVYYVDVKNDKLNQLSNIKASSPAQFFCGNDSLILFISSNLDGITRMHWNGGWGTFTGPLAETEVPDTMFVVDGLAYLVVQLANKKHQVISFDYYKGQKNYDGLNPKDAYNNVEAISAFGKKSIFSALHPNLGQELFITDGTDSGTVLLADINKGSASSNPDNFYIFKDKLIFTATTADKGREVWITDGTTAGTKLLWDIQPGTASANPTEYSAYKGYLYIAASDSIRERSLYRFVVDSCDIIDPVLIASNSNNTICDGQSISLYAKTQIAVNNISWLKNGSPMAFINDTFTTNEIAKYQFVVQQGSCSIASNELELTAAPAVSFTAGFESDSGFCAGESVILIATGNSDLKVKWYKNDEEYSSNLQTATFSDGTFYAIGKNQYGCADTSRTLEVIAYQTPKPFVNYTSIDTLFCSLVGSEYTYQWFFKGAEIPGETNYYLVIKENGAYKVVVTNANGCNGESLPFKYEGNSIDDIIKKWQIAAYPNPFNKQTNISYTLPTEKWVNIEIYNTTGQKITTLVSNKQTAGAYQHTFLAQNTGVYFVKINIGSETAILRMVNME